MRPWPGTASAHRARASLVRLALLLGCVAIGAGAAFAQSLAVAAASDLQAALPGIAERFEAATGSRVTLTFGSSGNFYAQIENGAPFDVLMSADIDYPRRLEQAGRVVPGSLYEYATGRLVLWTRRGSGLDVTRGLRALVDPKIRRIAIANPQHAPYGRAAVAALEHEGVYEAVRGKLVMGENISQAAQFAQSGNADAGVIALSLALSPAMKDAGAYAEIPVSFHAPLRQAAVIVARTKQRALAQRFLDALKTPESTRVLRAFGFAVPDTPPR